MTKILVLYYSRYGHVARLATAIAEGSRSVPKTEVVIKRRLEQMELQAL